MFFLFACWETRAERVRDQTQFTTSPDDQRDQRGNSWHVRRTSVTKKKYKREFFLSARAGETHNVFFSQPNNNTRIQKKRAEKIVIRENNGFRALRSGRVGGLDAFVEKSKSDNGEK